MNNFICNDVSDNGADTLCLVIHTVDDLTTPEIAMADMQVLAETVKRMHHCIVVEAKCSVPLFLNYAEYSLSALNEVMNAYNNLTGQDKADIRLHDLLGDDVAADLQYDGEFDIDDEESNRFTTYLNSFPSCRCPWESPEDPELIYYTQEAIELYFQGIKDEHTEFTRQTMNNMYALAARIKYMYHCIVDQAQFSFPVFWDESCGYLYAMSEEMDTYNGLADSSNAISLEDMLGAEIAAAVKYYNNGGEYDVNKEDEEAAWSAYLADFPHGCRPWDVQGENKFGHYTKEDFEWYRKSFKSGCLPPPSCLLPVSDSQ